MRRRLWQAGTILTIVLASAALAGAACVPPPLGLTNWWPGDGNTNDIVDSQPGTLMNGASFAPGKVHQAFSLDGVDDFVSFGDGAILQPATLTLDMWVKAAPPAGSAYLLAKGALDCNHSSYAFPAFSQGLFFEVVTNDGIFDSPAIPNGTVFDGTFHHIAGTFDGAFVRIFLDGVQFGAATPATGAIGYDLPDGDDLKLGRFGGTCTNPLSFGGVIDELELFNRALTTPEIAAIFAAGSDGKCRPTAAPALGADAIAALGVLLAVLGVAAIRRRQSQRRSN